MSTTNRLIKFFSYLGVYAFALITLSSTIDAQAAELIVKGKVTKGTCSVGDSSMEVIFPKPLMISDINNNVDDNTNVLPFSLKYSCQEFDVTAGVSPYIMKVTAGTSINVTSENKFYPKDNTTNAAFVLKYCDKNEANCKIIDIAGGGLVSFGVTGNGDEKHNFEVNVVKLGTENLHPGELTATVDITLLQP